MPSPPPSGRHLAAALLHASDWFNDALLARLEARGWPALSRTQSLVFVSLGAASRSARGGARPAELARRVGIRRQSMQTLLGELAAEGLVVSSPDPTDARATVVRLTPRGRRLVRDAASILRVLEAELASRIGADAVAALRAALDRDWGPTPVA